MKIRESIENYKRSIRLVHQNAFDQSEGETVSQLAIDLLEDKTALPMLSLVAEQDNEIIGNVIFSSVNINGVEGASAYILAPLAVTRLVQGSGVGAQLINKGQQFRLLFIPINSDVHFAVAINAGPVHSGRVERQCDVALWVKGDDAAATTHLHQFLVHHLVGRCCKTDPGVLNTRTGIAGYRGADKVFTVAGGAYCAGAVVGVGSGADDG